MKLGKNYSKMIASCDNHSHQVSWRLDKNCGFFINGQVLRGPVFLLRPYNFPHALGAAAEWVQWVHVHPSIFANGSIAALLIDFCPLKRTFNHEKWHKSVKICLFLYKNVFFRGSWCINFYLENVLHPLGRQHLCLKYQTFHTFLIFFLFLRNVPWPCTSKSWGTTPKTSGQPTVSVPSSRTKATSTRPECSSPRSESLQLIFVTFG